MQAPGTYWGTLIEAVTTTSGKKETPCIALVFNVSNGPVNAAGEYGTMANPINRTVRWYLTERAIPHTEKKLDDYGFNGDYDNIALPGLDEGVDLTLTYEGEWENWDIAHNGGTSKTAVKPADKNLIKKLNARYKTSHKKATGVPSGPPKAAAPGKPVLDAKKQDKALSEAGVTAPAEELVDDGSWDEDTAWAAYGKYAASVNAETEELVWLAAIDEVGPTDSESWLKVVNECKANTIPF